MCRTHPRKHHDIIVEGEIPESDRTPSRVYPQQYGGYGNAEEREGLRDEGVCRAPRHRELCPSVKTGTVDALE